MANTVLGLAVMIGVDVWLIPAHGAIGAGIGWAAALVAKNLAGAIQVLRAHRMHAFGHATLLMIPIAAACFGGISALTRLAIEQPAVSLVVGLVLASAVYVPMLWLLRGPLELKAFTALRRRQRA
jgi:hypothetical protein